MEKEEILAKSREANKNKDPYELEVRAQAGQMTVVVMATLAGVFLILQIAWGGGINYGLYGLVAAGNMTMDWMKWSRLRRRRTLISALFWTIAALALCAAHICLLRR